ncbi:unnamed protein product [Linum trigynum]|uniref:Uncharacterized protein n=1 Tax=Linum trigynum TaxID=586398 RepID=A0AAV2E3H4_9ROSI
MRVGRGGKRIGETLEELERKKDLREEQGVAIVIGGSKESRECRVLPTRIPDPPLHWLEEESASGYPS